MSLSFLLCCLLCFVCRSSVTLDEEPMCSKFQYDKQMLEAMVRMEAKMAQLKEDRKEFDKSVLSILEQRKEEMDEVVRTQNRKLEKLIAENNDVRNDVRNKTAHMEILAENIKDTPKVAFNAYTTASGKYPENKVIVFPDVLLNEGGGYNKYTGTFTAPVSGLYHFTAHVCQPSNYNMIVSIVHGSKKLATTSVVDADTYTCTSVSAPALANKGESVFIKSSYSGSKLYADSLHRLPSFSGFLVNK